MDNRNRLSACDSTSGGKLEYGDLCGHYVLVLSGGLGAIVSLFPVDVGVWVLPSVEI
ncbi:hypothetical protein CCP3SC15_1580007 [Gammaproteobacteria bacterium]